MEIEISRSFASLCPAFKAIAIQCQIQNTIFNNKLWHELDTTIEQIKNNYALSEINSRPAIRATREVYKKLGKDPNRYRPSAEALCRRIVRDMDLYKINTLVDLINLVSIHSGYSIGGFDVEKIEGPLELGIGQTDDCFHAIGRGLLNIEGLPVYRDSAGGIGTPTSDEERTKLTPETTGTLIIINAFGYHDLLDEAVKLTISGLTNYLNGENIIIKELIA